MPLLKAEELQAPVSLTLSADDGTLQHAHLLTFLAEEDKQYPDFIVVKATERMDADRIILVFELKRDELGNATGVAQLRKYMQRIGLKPANLLVDVVGYLVSPRRTQEHRLLAPGPNGRRAWADRQIFPSGSDSFVAAIHAFAIAEWNT